MAWPAPGAGDSEPGSAGLLGLGPGFSRLARVRPGLQPGLGKGADFISGSRLQPAFVWGFSRGAPAKSGQRKLKWGWVAA
jgi:hypothetical protein